MDIMSLFRTAPAAPAAPAAQPGPTQVANPGAPLPGTQSSNGTAPNGVVPTQSISTPTPTSGEQSPLSNFADIWKTDPNAAVTDTSIFGVIDPAKVMEAAKKLDFSKSVTPEILAKIQAGGPEAAAAFQSAMNSVGQLQYAQSAMATTKIVEQAVAKVTERFNAQLPSMVKQLSTREGLQTSNPILSNPAVQPMVEALTSQLLTKNPNATSAEIQTQVADYFASLGQVFAPKAPQTAAQKNASTSDWSMFE
jgi:hypothetical protein